MINRDENSFPASINLSDIYSSIFPQSLPEGKAALPASDEMYDFYPIVVVNGRDAPILAPNDIAVEFYGHTLFWQRKKIEQFVKFDATADLLLFAVEIDRDHC